jgi:Transposase DDE domain group 1
MIPEELRSRMRRLFFAEHWKVGTIAAELGVHHDTVALAIEAPRFVNIKYRALASVLDPYKSLIQLTLKDHPRLLATRLYDMITPRGYTGSVVQLRRYVRTIRPVGQREAFFRLRTLPGEQAQVDWGCFGSLVVGNPRFVVTTLDHVSARMVYEHAYCGRGNAENRIKDFKNALDGDRLSCTTYVANAFRLLLHAFAYRLLDALRAHLKVVAPELGRAQFDTIRLRLLKVAAHVRQSVRRIAVSLPSSFGLAHVFAQVAARLAALTLTP